jgi:hypothetical protein
MKKLITGAAIAALAATPLSAETRLSFEPIAIDGNSVRYTQGEVTVDSRREHGAVQLMPLGLDHGRLTFGVSVLNLGTEAYNFGISDIHATVGGQDVVVLSRERLDQMARRRAGWAQFAVALAAGLGAAAAASSHNTYRATTYGPRGTYRTIIRTQSAGGQVAAAATVAGGAYTVAQIQNQLDPPRAALAEEIVQTTTVDPEDSYAGRFVIEKPTGRVRGWPQDVRVVVTMNGEEHQFAFHAIRAR